MKRQGFPLAVLLLVGLRPAPATTITVGQDGGYDYATIQAAIDAATTGDTVLVYPGTYLENIHFKGKNIILRSTEPRSWDAATSTILDGQSSGPVVTFLGTETSSCILTGFIIQNGSAAAGGGILGGTSTSHTKAIIQRNIIKANEATGGGGGIALCDGRIEDNTILLNLASSGGGLCDCDGTIQGNSVIGNSAEWSGGGLYGCGGLIVYNVIRHNTAYEGGGLAYCSEVRGNTITHNRAFRRWTSEYAEGYGGGLSGCRRIENNVINHNFAYTLGSAISRCFDGTIQNNTIAHNKGADVLYGCEGIIRNCIFHENEWPHDLLAQSSIPTYSCGMSVGVGNISGNPQFLDPASGDFHLLSSSPCIDAGDPASDYSHEPEPNGGRVNMGAYGNTPEAASATADTDGDGLPDEWERRHFGNLDQHGDGDPDGDGVPNRHEYGNGTDPAPPRRIYVDGSVLSPGDGTSWTTAVRTIQEGIRKARNGDTVVVAPGIYFENLTLAGKNISLRSTDPLDPEVVARTVIDGAGADAVVTYWGVEDETGELAGFTIQNGYGLNGGGICGGWEYDSYGGWHSDVHIHHNVIRNNEAYRECWDSSGYPPYPGWGYACEGFDAGGGINWCDGLIEYNIIRGNAASSGGGLNRCHGTIRHNTISDNDAYHGGGLRECTGSIRFNTIANNRSIYDGAGLDECNGRVQNNIIQGNSAGRSGGGLAHCDGRVVGNEITDNSAGKSGGGVSGCHGRVQRNTIAGNVAGQHGGGAAGCDGVLRNNLIVRNAGLYGGGVSLCNRFIQNNTIADNKAGFGGGLYECPHTIESCIVWGNTATTGPAQLDACTTPAFSCIEGWTSGGIGNIDSAPLFVDAGGPDDDPDTYEDNDYRLAAASPCVDAGRNGYWYDWPIRELDGNCRLAGAAIDIGCYEYGGRPDADGDLLCDADETIHGTESDNLDTDGDHLEDGLEILRGSDPALATPPGIFHVPTDRFSIQEGICLAVWGDEVIVAPRTYRKTIRFLGKNVTLRSTDPTVPAVVAATVLDGNWLGSVVTFDGPEGSSAPCVLSGFTIRNGAASYGGGIKGNESCVSIESNVISGNTAWYYESSRWLRFYGAGSGIHECAGTIRKNTITDNRTNGRGGGLYGCTGLIEHNTITSNSANLEGGGLAHCDAVIQHNRITGNSSRGDGGGLDGCEGTILHNMITSNSARWEGGGLSNCRGVIQFNEITRNFAGDRGGGLGSCRAVIRNNEISGNSAPVGGGLSRCWSATISLNLIASNSATSSGGALAHCSDMIHNNLILGNVAAERGGAMWQCRYATIENNTVCGNSAGERGGGLSECIRGATRNCILWNNTAPVDSHIHDSATPTYSCIDGWTHGGAGNISMDPMFIDPDGPDNNPLTWEDNDYSLLSWSRCIDAGDPAPEYNDGCRPPGLGTERNDMGAYGGPHNCGWPAVWPPSVDLAVILTDVQPKPVIAGAPVYFEGEIANEGDLACQTSVRLVFDAINNVTGWSGALCDSVVVGPLRAGGTFDLAHVGLKTHATIPAGIYTIEMRVDATNAVAEVDETNNIARLERCVILPDRPNLAAAGFDFAPQEVAHDGGTTMTFSGRVVNSGVQPTGGGFWLEFYVSETLPFTFPGDYLCDSYRITSPLAPGEAIDLAALPPRATYTLAAGVYYVAIRLDALDEVAEQREDDNVIWLGHKKLYVGTRPTASRRWTRYR